MKNLSTNKRIEKLVEYKIESFDKFATTYIKCKTENLYENTKKKKKKLSKRVRRK
jgi:uncharacterized membrane protein